jgi:hypothetical protein
MDSVLKNFLEQKKNLVGDTKIPAIHKQKTIVPKPGKDMMDKHIESDPYKRLANMVIKEKPAKKDLVEKFQQFITAAEALL